MITTTTINGVTVWERTTSTPNFMAVISPITGKIVECHYDSLYYGRPYPIIEPSPQALFKPDGSQRTQIEAFLLTLYFAAIDINPQGADNFDLHQELKLASQTAQYGSVVLPDFMAFLGAKSRFYKEADGVTKNILETALTDPNAPRPYLVDMPDEDSSTMFSIIRYLGLFGIIPHLFASGGITFEQMCTEAKLYYPDLQARTLWYNTELNPFLRSKKVPILSIEQVNGIL